MNGRWNRRGATIFALLVVGAAFGWWWWAGRPQPAAPWSPARYLPADADVALWTAPVGQVAGRLGDLGDQVPGLAGVFDLLRSYAGVDLRDEQATERAGLRRDAGTAVCVWRNAVWWTVPVRGPQGAQHVVETLRRRGYGIGAPRPTAHGRSWLVTDRQGQADRARLWHGPDAVVLRVALDPTPTGNEADALGALLTATPRTDLDLRGAVARAELHWGEAGRGARLVRDALHQALGPADLVIGAVADRAMGASVALEIDAQGLAARLALRSLPGKLQDIAQWHQGFIAKGGELSLADLLPDETPLVASARLNPGLWNNLPELLRDRVLPASALRALHESLGGVDARQLLAQLDGQVAIAVLAVGDEVPLDPTQWPNLWWRTALRIAVGVAARTDVEAAALADKLRSAVDTSADRSQPAQYGAWTGFSVPGPGAPWMVLRQGRQLAMIAGPGAADDLRRVAEGRFGALAKVATAPVEHAIASGQDLWLGARVGTARIVRSLRRRGVPDYALQLVGAVETVSARVRLTADEVVVDVALRPSGRKVGRDKAVLGAGDGP